MRRSASVLFAVLFASVVTAPFTLLTTPAAAQATCRNKCNEDEQACLKRTNNKSQCGNRAKECAAKCK